MCYDVIFVLLDGFNYSVVCDCMGYFQVFCGVGCGQLYCLECELFLLFWLFYECIFIGVLLIDSGILYNDVVCLSQEQSLFYYVCVVGLSIVVVVYYWVSELYNCVLFDLVCDCYIDDSVLLIQCGYFYWSDYYLDLYLFVDVESLCCWYVLNFMLVYLMNIDDVGYRYGFVSFVYCNVVWCVDVLLLEYLYQWLVVGYQVVIIVDYGMNEDCSYGGIFEEECEVLLFVFGDVFSCDDLV